MNQRVVRVTACRGTLITFLLTSCQSWPAPALWGRRVLRRGATKSLARAVRCAPVASTLDEENFMRRVRLLCGMVAGLGGVVVVAPAPVLADGGCTSYVGYCEIHYVDTSTGTIVVLEVPGFPS